MGEFSRAQMLSTFSSKTMVGVTRGLVSSNVKFSTHLS